MWDKATAVFVVAFFTFVFYSFFSMRKQRFEKKQRGLKEEILYNRYDEDMDIDEGEKENLHAFQGAYLHPLLKDSVELADRQDNFIVH